MMPQSPSKLAPWDLTQLSQSPSAAPSYFPDCHWWPEISFPSKVIAVLGKARSYRAPNLGCRGAESPGWFDILPKNSAQDIMHEQVCFHEEAADHQLPMAVTFWIIQIVSVEECSSLTQNSVHIQRTTCSVILNVTATQHTCWLNNFYCPHWLAQWSRLCSHTHIPVHSPWLAGYINVTQTVLVILTMAGLFLDCPYNMCVYICMLLRIFFFFTCENFINSPLCGFKLPAPKPHQYS